MKDRKSEKRLENHIELVILQIPTKGPNSRVGGL